MDELKAGAHSLTAEPTQMPAVKIEQTQFERILRRNVTLPLVTGLLSSILFVLVVLYLIGSLRAAERAQEVITHAAELGRLTAESENGVRGFVITGDPRFMDTYEVAQPQFAAQVETLQRLVGADAAQAERLRRVQAEYTQWVKEFARATIDLRQRDAAAATQTVMTGRGKRLTDSLREEFAGMIDAERRNLADRTERASTMAMWLAIAYVVVLMGFKGLLVFFGRRDLMSLSQRYGTALAQQSEHNAFLQAQGWIRDAQNE